MSSTTHDSSFEPAEWSWKRFHWRGDWRLFWFLLLLPVALLMPAWPIDETRYLAVAWEMYERFDFGLLYLSGQPYSEKGPLLFWLINLVWLFSGTHLWIVRVLALAISTASLVMFQRLAYRLNPLGHFAQQAASIFSGIVFFSAFSSAVMFDVLLTACVLLTLHGVLDLHARHWNWAIVTMAIGMALGFLTKGPVILLDTAWVLILGPWWSETARAFKSRWYSSGALALLAALLLALCWAVPASLRGGSEYAHSIFLGQTVNRVANSIAHARPFWWYLPLLPAMVLPWTISVRAPWRVWRHALTDSISARFAVAWFIPAFMTLSFVSGKQPHYLLPLLPALALYLSGVLRNSNAKLQGRAFGWTLIVGAIGFLSCKYVFPAIGTLNSLDDTVTADLSPIWPAIIGTLGSYLVVNRRGQNRVNNVAFASVVATAVVMLGAVQTYAPRTDIANAAKRIQHAQLEHSPVVSLGPHHGLFEFEGRLTDPMDALAYSQLPAWCAKQPTGEVVTFYKKHPITAKPVSEHPFQSGSVRFWSARDVCSSLNSNVATSFPDEPSDP